MEYIYDAMIQTTRQMQQRQQTVQPERSGDTDSFRKLMEKQQAKDTDSQQPAAREPVSESETPLEETDAGLQEQMTLAAMAAWQNPIVPMETVESTGTPEIAVTQLAEGMIQSPAAVVQQGESQHAASTMQQTQMPEGMAPQLEGQEAAAEVSAKSLSDNTVVGHSGQKAAVEAGTQEQGEMAAVQNDQESTPAEDGVEQFSQTAKAETPVFKEVREIPVKVGETATVETQLGEKLTQALQNGESRVEIQLEPENLGRVTVELTWSKDGMLHVALHAENSQTRGLLERDAFGLQSLLSRNTQQDVQVEVQRQQESQQQNLYEDGRQGNQQNRQQHHREQRHSGQDFLQQLRLGLIPLDEEVS